MSEGETAPRVFTWPDKKRPRICILGGGFGGLYTALRLESLEWPDDKKPQVLLVDQSERFVFKPMLYELLTGEVDSWEIAPRFSELLANTSVQFFKDTVKLLRPSDHLGVNGPTISMSGGTVLLESGLVIEYDWLVLSLGAEPKLDVVPGAQEFALPFSTLEDACRVDRKLSALERRNFGKDSLIRVVVVGCGYSGVELAATVSERLEDRGIVQAINVETTICPTAPPGNREVALKVLSARKVQLLLGYFVRCIRRVGEFEASVKPTNSGAVPPISAEDDLEKYILELQPAVKGFESQILEADLVLWTVGSKPLLPQVEPCINKPPELPLNARGQAETDETLRVKGHPRIFALGDSSALRDSKGRLLPATAQVAFQQADFAGWNLWAAINGRPLLPFRFQNLGEMMTLGRNDASSFPEFYRRPNLRRPYRSYRKKASVLD
ncbi:alternative NAD(P)H-ubiquinone oxidoreductase C1, chloroplastic/mitochondrial-like [Melia azedarach]|uniref:Alternative NAD(P)H-ubiquinone oxidoreductase C1, chloroplastic/mitochondrial-like n=1 Tax=Melia azedarach TaxID=155640 RepID=A0ACC1XUK8_MELAZ|nr:alternative NAD(P)H-ubiquinone oxidoreductase C1, chloroplastic/mitochondrial-like [Melia azedarach]